MQNPSCQVLQGPPFWPGWLHVCRPRGENHQALEVSLPICVHTQYMHTLFGPWFHLAGRGVAA